MAVKESIGEEAVGKPKWKRIGNIVFGCLVVGVAGYIIFGPSDFRHEVVKGLLGIVTVWGLSIEQLTERIKTLEDKVEALQDRLEGLTQPK